MPTCSYCGFYSPYPVCPYDGTAVNEGDRRCRNSGIRHSLEIPLQYRRYFQDWRVWTLAACPNCKTPYFYTHMPLELRQQYDKQRQAQGCFIATAALGSHLHPHIQSLRYFRDNILLRSRHRKSFDSLLNRYYKLSPPIAKLMNRYRLIRIVMRYTIVYPVVIGIKLILPIVNIILGIEKDAANRSGSI
jgi:hypothetical protein